MATLVTVADAAARTGKSERSIWRYVQQLEERGVPVVYKVPGLSKTVIDLDAVERVARSQRRGNPRHRGAKTTNHVDGSK